MLKMILILVALGSSAASAGAQVRGRVSDADGRAVDHALVELWTNQGRIDVVRTGGDGAFGFAVGAPGDRLVVRRIGYRPGGAVVGTTRVDVRLTTFAVHLADIGIRAGDQCARSEDAMARNRWEAAAARYRASRGEWRDRAAMHSRMMTALVPASQLGVIDTMRLVPAGIAGGGDLLPALDRRVLTEGYVWQTDGLHSTRSGPLEYPRLESVAASHFASPAFGSLHRLSFDDSASRIRFCPAGAEHPGIEGVITLGADTSIVYVSWVFVSTDPGHRLAGGEVAFAPSPGVLIPTTGLFWQRRLGGRYYQEWWEFGDWCEGRRGVNCREPKIPR